MNHLIRAPFSLFSSGLISYLALFAGTPASAKQVQQGANPSVVISPAISPLKTQNLLTETQQISEDPSFGVLGAKAKGSAKSKLRTKSQATVAAPFYVIPPEASSASSRVSINDNTNPSSVTAHWQDPKKDTPNKSLGLSLQLSQTAGLYDHRDGTREKSADMELGLSYKLPADTTLTAKISGSIDQNNYENNDMGQASVGASKSGYDYFSAKTHQKLFSLTPSVSVQMPISKAHRNQSFQGGFSPGVRLTLDKNALPSERLSLSFSLRGSRNFYTFDQTAGGASNTQYSSSQSVALGYELPADFEISLNLSHFNSWTFRGTPGESFSHSEELGYKISKSWAAALGHQFGSPAASIYKADGQTSNFDLANENDSYVYAALTYTY